MNQASNSQVEINGVTLTLSRDHEFDHRWIGQEDVLRQLLACWLVVGEEDLPLTPRLIGPPGLFFVNRRELLLNPSSCGIPFWGEESALET